MAKTWVCSNCHTANEQNGEHCIQCGAHKDMDIRPVTKRFQFDVVVTTDAIELMTVLHFAMDQYKDLSFSDQQAVVAWFTKTYGEDDA